MWTPTSMCATCGGGKKCGRSLEAVLDLLGFKSINVFDKALSSKACLLNFHKEANLALWLYFYFYLLHSLIPR